MARTRNQSCRAVACLSTDRDQAVLAAFARHANDVVAEIDVLGIQADEFGEPQSG